MSARSGRPPKAAVTLPSGLLPSSVLQTAEHHPPLADTTGLPTCTLPDLGPCVGSDVEFVAIIDNSPSVTGVGGADPTSNRLAEVRRAVRYIAGSCRCRRERVSVVSFDQPGPGTALHQPLSHSGLRRLDHALIQMPRGPGASSITPALNVAELLIDRASGPLVLAVFSDFLLTDSDPPAAMDRLLGLRAFKHAVVLEAEPPAALLASPDVTTGRITIASPAGSVSTALVSAFSHARQASASAAQDSTRVYRAKSAAVESVFSTHP